jgi:hypothetical protein
MVFPAGVGVNIHFVTGHERDLDLIAAAGFKFLRMDFGWEGTETTKGKYDWSAYDELITHLEKRGLRAVFILDYSHSLYEETVNSVNPLNQQPHRTLASPQHPESVAAYAGWAAASVRHFKGRHIIWEIWNEPNIQFWNPKPDVQQYTSLALAACKAIRAAEPEATIVGPASSGFPWEFLETFLKSGVLEYLDAVSVHPYREYHRPPETAGADYEKLRALIHKYAPANKGSKIPVLSGEWGYASHTKGVSPETQAAFVVRQQLVNLLYGIPLSIWYDWKNDGTNPDEREENFGTVQSELEPKPAYVAVQNLTRELDGYRIAKRLELESEKDYVFLCEKGGQPSKLVCWTLGDPHPVKITTRAMNSPRLTGLRADGGSGSVSIQGNQLNIEVTSMPQFVTLAGVSL